MSYRTRAFYTYWSAVQPKKARQIGWSLLDKMMVATSAGVFVVVWIFL